MFDLTELDRWDEALASLTAETPVQTPVSFGHAMRPASPPVGSLTTPRGLAGGGCPFGHGRTTHDG